ncbi:MAG: LemA family protein [Lactobacillales bacterium]|jgi:LemA protein|nr:LemA family protein [Lactobacillales bacterium]
MKKGIVFLIVLVALIAFIGMKVVSTLNGMVALDEGVKAEWSQVLNQYKRRTDLIPNLVSTVKGYAAHEQQTLQAVIEARAKATSTTVSPDMLSDAGAMQAFMDNQNALSSALSRLMVVVEKYPDLKANQNFLALQSQLEGTENRITVARQDYINAVRQYNTRIRTIPTSWIMAIFSDQQAKAVFEIPAAEQQAPVVSF